MARYGFKKLAYSGLETGSKDICTHVIQQGKIIIGFRCSLDPSNDELSQFLKKHGDSVRDIAFTVDNCEAIYNAAIKGGAKSVKTPTTTQDENGTVTTATVAVYNDVVHSFIERKKYKGLFLPGFKAYTDPNDPLSDIIGEVGLEAIDHVVSAHPLDTMDNVIEWYNKTLSFKRFWAIDSTVVHGPFSGMKYAVVTDDSYSALLPIVEPINTEKMRSPIQEYLDFHGGAGVQHIAMSTKDIIKAVSTLKKRGVKFLPVPATYYQVISEKMLNKKVTYKMTEDFEKLKELNIMIDYDTNGYLLQIFTKPLTDRPTAYTEIIQRYNHNGFGHANFESLFDALERESQRRQTN